MKRKLLILAPIALTMMLASCGGTPETPASSASQGTSSQDTSAKTDSSSSVESAKAKFLITFKDEEGTTLDSKEWEEGTTPS